MGIKHPHFYSLRDSVMAAWPLRDTSRIARWNQAGNWTYDPVEDAACATMDGALISFGPAQQITLPFPRVIDSVAGDKCVSVQFEAKWGAEWVGNLGALNTHKCFRIDDAGKTSGSTEPRVHEFQMRYSLTGSDAVAVPTLRTYDCVNSPSLNEDPLRDRDTNPINMQPGGPAKCIASQAPFTAAQHLAPGKPYLILPDKWYRFTYVWDIEVGRVTLTVDDGSAPVTVIDYATRRTNGRNCADSFRFEYNSSQTGSMVGPHRLWCRNVLVDDKPIPFRAAKAVLAEDAASLNSAQSDFDRFTASRSPRDTDGGSGVMVCSSFTVPANASGRLRFAVTPDDVNSTARLHFDVDVMTDRWQKVAGAGSRGPWSPEDVIFLEFDAAPLAGMTLRTRIVSDQPIGLTVTPQL